MESVLDTKFSQIWGMNGRENELVPREPSPFVIEIPTHRESD